MRTFLLLIIFLSAHATANDSVWVHRVNKPVDAIYGPIYKSLEEANFYVVFEPDIGKNISSFSERWGNEYNRNQLTQIRSMVFCNGWYANQVGNADPDMLALCPLHITLTEKEGRSTVLFVRPSAVAKGSRAEAIAREIENKVIMAIEDATCDTPTC
ncbi:MAG: DUF302 domain-containing protein [Arenicellales bacterium]